MQRILVGFLSCWILTVGALAEDGGHALRDAARAGDRATVERLVEAGADVNAKTSYGATALSYAADKGHVEIVRFLLERGADVNATDSFYNATPVLWASFNEHVEIVELLLSKGATGADSVLSTGVRSNNAALVAATLKSESVTRDGIAAALAAARNADEPAEEIVAMLEAARGEEIEAEPEGDAVTVEAEVLGRYVGKFQNEQLGMELQVRVEEGKLIAQVVGQNPLTMRPLSETRFQAIEFSQVELSFSGTEESITTATVHQGGQTFDFPRIVESAEAEPEEEALPPLPAVERTAAQPWPSFRGTNASGIGDGQGAPTEWDVASGKNILWKTPVPGLANSSPIIWGDRVIVTTAVSEAEDDTFRTGLYGDVDSVEDLSVHEFKVLALDRSSGEIVWERTAGKSVPGAKRHLKSTQANSTPVTDGKRVVALFGTVGLLVAYDMKGKLLWETDIGVLDAGWFYDETYQWGHASSPVIHDGLVIVQADIYKDSFLAAYKLKNGKQAWKTMRDEIPTWGTPTVHRGKHRDELITNGTTIRGYDPKTGKELWTLGPNSEVTVATPIVANELIYVTAGYPPVQPVYAIRPGQSGDLSLAEEATSSDAVAWSHARGGTYMPTPIAYGGHLYTCANDGRLTAYDAKTGERVYRQRVGAGTYTASPIAADGKLYFTTEEGDVIVARAGATYEELARNEMDGVCMSTPAISDGMLVVRTQNHVYGIRESSGGASGN
ncbi:MAG: PQQ-binding-like beta-propeller repeat protein [bacterium]|nr:PQQ-binding-like beta-propeller repeat protein [bacterium]